MNLRGLDIERVIVTALSPDEWHKREEPAPPQLVAGKIPGDPEEPRPQRVRIAQLCSAFHRANERVVHQISRPFTVAQQLDDKARQLLGVPFIRRVPVNAAADAGRGRHVHAFHLYDTRKDANGCNHAQRLRTSSSLLLEAGATAGDGQGRSAICSETEATAGIEPAMKVLQTSALPLGYVADE